jgi:NADP-dependent 3-hydroxy acid dehydrogenase YdfG
MSTILITGSSTGIGKVTARYFASKGWNVIATMRKPEQETELNLLPNVLLLPLDVTDQKSIDQAIADGVLRFGKIDAIVNNAGFAVGGPFETATEEQIGKQFATNVGGIFACVRGILPHFRANNSGVIVNVASMGGRACFPYFSLYHSTKWAVDGFSESLWYEMRNLGIKVKIIEPGAIKTDFYGRSQTFSLDENKTDEVTMAYKEDYLPIKKTFDQTGNGGANPEIVAKTIYRAVTDNSHKLRYTVGLDAKILLFLRWLLPNQLMFEVLNFATNKLGKK